MLFSTFNQSHILKPPEQECKNPWDIWHHLKELQAKT